MTNVERALAAVERDAPPEVIIESVNAHAALAYRCTRVLARRQSAYQQIEVLDTPAFGRVLRIDGTTMTSERDEFFYHENLVHVPALAHPQPRCVAIIGGGDGGALREVLKHASVERAHLVELDPAVVEMSRAWLPTLHRGAFDDPLAALHYGDGRAWLAASRERFDLLLLDLTDPTGPAHDLYTAEFYRICRERLGPDGILGLHIQSPVTRPQTFARIVRTLRSEFTYVRPYLVFVPTYGTWFGMATASLTIDPICDTVQTLAERIAARKLGTLRYCNPATHLAGFALPNFALDLMHCDLPPVTLAGPRLDAHAEFAQTFVPGSQ